MNASFLNDNLRPLPGLLESADREHALSLRIVSRYHLDPYGQPRPLSRLEVILHAMAWPAMIGVIIGFGLAISLFILHNPACASHETVTRAYQVLSEEDDS